MRLFRVPIFRIVLTIFGFSTVILADEISEHDLGPFVRPEDGANVKSFVTKRAKGVVGEIAKTESFQKWKSFEDDMVTFRYPDHKAISVEVKSDEAVPVDGARVSSVDTSFSRAYRLTAGGETLLVIMLQEADWLDDGVCFCGAVVYDRYLVRNGNLYRFSFLRNGVLKKMQVLGDGKRMMMFEWTHLPMHAAVYQKIAQSLHFKKKGPWAVADCRERVHDNYGAEGVIGWFDKGSTAESVVKILGKPKRIESSGVYVWEYPKEEDGYRWIERLSLPFANGKLSSFDSSYHDSGWNNRKTITGSIPWMMKVAEPYEDPPVRGEKAKRMPERLKKQLLSLFFRKAQEKEVDFNSLCQVMKILVEQGVKDEKALGIVRKRFSSEGGHYAAWVLHEAGYAEDVTLFIEKVRELYRDANDNPNRNLGISDLHNWLAFIPDDDKRYPGLLRDGLKSRHADVREDAYYFLDSAPFSEEERIAFVHTGLRDPSARVRYWSARYYDGKDLSHQDRELLRKVAEKEKDRSTLGALKKLIEEHEIGK